MKIRSKLVSLAFVAAMLIFTICQGLHPMDENQSKKKEITKSEEADKSSLLPASDDKETIYFWYTDEALSDYLGSCALTFMEENPNVRVVPTLTSAVEYLEAINKASTQEEVYPDLYVVTNDCLEKAYLSGLATALSEEENTFASFSDTACRAVTYEGKKVAYPFYFETSLFLYNKSYLEQMAMTKEQELLDTLEGEQAQSEADALAAAGEEPVSGDEIGQTTEASTESQQSGEAVNSESADDTSQNQELNEEIAEESGTSILDQDDEEIADTLIPVTFNEILTLADEYDAPENVEAILRWDVSDVFYNYFFAGNYMNIGGVNGDDKNQIDLNNEQVIQCLTVYQGLNQFFSIDAKQTSYETVLQDFIDGKIIFTVATTDAMDRLDQAKEDGSFDFEYGIAPIPNVTKELSSKGLSVTNTVVVNGFGQHQNAANAFAKYLTTQSDGELYHRTKKMPACKEVQNQDEKQMLILQAYEQSTSLPKLMRASNFWVQLEAAYTDIWNGKDAKEVLDGLQQQMQSQIQN